MAKTKTKTEAGLKRCARQGPKRGETLILSQDSAGKIQLGSK
jgi:hypothetical protein